MSITSDGASAQSLGIRILIAEDNLINQKLVLQLLKRQGHQVDVAANGEEAVELFRRAPYPLVLMDAQMPEMDGYEATRAIRSLERGGQRAIIIALTANVMSGDRDRCLEAGMDDYLPKPIQAHEFYDSINAWIARIEKRPAAKEPA
jgi:two-component system, sensor histidine kinase and response regulator